MIDLDDLEELFDDLGFGEPTPEQIEEMYEIFLNDFVKNTLIIKGKVVKYDGTRSKDPRFRGMEETFRHIVTRKSKMRGRREFDHQRANRIHWIKPILKNADDSRVLYFERLNDRNQNQQYYWYKQRDFLVILRETEPDVLLVTSFYVDDLEKALYMKLYREYKGL
jgi:hypothetical protein